jgi:hypothetical protein
MTQCAVCGQAYGMTHACPGASASTSAYMVPDQWAAPTGFAPLFYIRQSIAIARFDDAAILAASRDRAALIYGVIFWLISRLLIYGAMFQIQFRAYWRGYSVSLSQLGFVILFAIVTDFAWILLQYGISHGLARWWFGARGSYLGILRAMSLGSLVLCTYVIPYVGIFIAGIWAMAILMCVFEEVDGIERMKAFALSYGFGALFFLLSLELSRPRQ